MEPIAAPSSRGRATRWIAIALAVIMLLLVVVLVTRRNAADRADFDPL